MVDDSNHLATCSVAISSAPRPARAPHRRVEVHNGLSHAQTELHAAVAQKLERVFVIVDVLCQAVWGGVGAVVRPLRRHAQRARRLPMEVGLCVARDDVVSGRVARKHRLDFGSADRHQVHADEALRSRRCQPAATPTSAARCSRSRTVNRSMKCVSRSTLVSNLNATMFLLSSCGVRAVRGATRKTSRLRVAAQGEA
jgi:hypothetical protein